MTEEECAVWKQRAEKAKARLAELVREVRAEIETAPLFGMRPALEAILKKYEGGTP